MFTRLKVGRLASGGIITNYFCTSACRHCLYNCGPHWEKNYSSVEIAEKNYRAVKSLGCPAVHIEGGEPMLRPEELGAVLDAAVREGVSIDYVETNSSWYKEPESAETLLAGLRPKGLHTLLVSISPFHNEHIPFSKIQGVMDVVFNWLREVHRFAPDLRVLTLHGKDRAEAFASIPHYDICITTYPLLWRDEAQLIRHEYHYVILDEAQSVKNAMSRSAGVVRKLTTRHRLCITGTPLENNLGELWSQFDFLMPGFLGDSKQFTATWRKPIEKMGNLQRRDILARRVAPIILRRRKEDVAKELPPKTIIVRDVELTGAQRDLYETVRSAMDEQVRNEIAARGFNRSQIVILDALLKLRQVCCDPRLLKTTAAARVRERAKLELLMEMVPELISEGRRILLFSQFTSMLGLIEEDLQASGSG